MRRLTAPLAFAALLLACPLAYAKSACMMQGQIMGQVINECTQTEMNLSEGQQKVQCSGQAPGLEGMGGQVDMRLVASCPSGAGGMCDSPRGAPAQIFYYQRTPDQLAALQAACESQRGHWSKL